MGQKINGKYIAFSTTTVFSDELVEKLGKGTEADTRNEPRTGEHPPPLPSTCQMYKYAPSSGHANANDEVLIVFTNKLGTRKYGGMRRVFLLLMTKKIDRHFYFYVALEITFEYDTTNDHWSEPVLDLEVKEQMASFLTPTFPFAIVDRTTVKVILKQKKRDFAPLAFDYLAPGRESVLFFDSENSLLLLLNSSTLLPVSTNSESTDTSKYEQAHLFGIQCRRQYWLALRSYQFIPWWSGKFVVLFREIINVWMSLDYPIVYS